MRASAFLIAILLTLPGCSPSASMAEEKTAIINLLQATYGGSDGDLFVDPVIVRTKFAVADWSRDGNGARVLMQKDGGAWKVVTVAGSEMRDAQFLEQAGVPEKEAKALYNALISAERDVPEERLAMFDRYEPVRR